MYPSGGRVEIVSVLPLSEGDSEQGTKMAGLGMEAPLGSGFW